MSMTYARGLTALLVASACGDGDDGRANTDASIGGPTSDATGNDDDGVATEPTSTSPVDSSGGGPDDGSSDGGSTGDEPSPVVWPNEVSFANSDPWISEHHAEIVEMRPRVLAINFVNSRSMEEMTGQLEEMIEILAEASRWRGHSDDTAPAFLNYELAYSADLRDAVPPNGWPYN